MATKYIQVLNRLRDQLLKREVGAQRLSELTGRNISQTSRWVNNKVQMTIPTLLMICEAINIDPVILFKEPTEKKKRTTTRS